MALGRSPLGLGLVLLLGFVLLVERAQHGGPVELTFDEPIDVYPDTPDFAAEGDMTLQDGVMGDHVGMWEAPQNYNDRGIADMARAQMDRRMVADAEGSSWYQMGAPDFAESDSLYNPGTDTDAVSLDSSYDNAWPGTGTGLRGWDDITSETDGYTGQWGVRELDTEAADSAAISGADLAGFKAASGAQQLYACEPCRGGRGCVAGCMIPGAVAPRGFVAKAAKGGSKPDADVAAGRAAPSRGQGHLCALVCGGDSPERVQCKCGTPVLVSNPELSVPRIMHNLGLLDKWAGNSHRLERAGVKVEGSPLTDGNPTFRGFLSTVGINI